MRKNILKVVAMVLFAFATATVSAQETIITKNELPAVASKFISSNFSGLNIDYIIKEVELLSTEYKVQFKEGVKIEFDGKGNWKEIDAKYSGKAIPDGAVPKKIKSYVAAKFSDTQIVKLEKSSYGKQEAKLSNGLELVFDANGNFVKLDD